MTQTISKIGTIFFCLSAVSSTLIIFIAVRYRLSGDLTYYVLPWFAHLTKHGLQAISGAYSDYPPTYLYLLATVAPLHPVISDVVLIKSVSVAFTFVAAFIVYLIVFEITMDQRISAVAGAGVLILPTVTMNSAYWGQSDVIYSTFVLGFVLFSLKSAPLRAVFCLGLAFSFKLQTIFVAPYVLYLILRRRIALQHLIVIPAVYAVAMLPAWLMGRPASELATIYFSQIHADLYDHRLSLSAPNLYEIIQNFQVIDYQAGVRTGIILAAAAGIALAVAAQRFRDNLQTDLLVATASVILMPFILPKMHDRYFFLADVFTYVLMFTFRRAWPLAMAMQIGSLSAYCRFLYEWHFGPDFGALAVSVAAVGIVWMCFVHARTTGRQSPQPPCHALAS
jgi:Gpi18-like mannosyltransferase